MSFGRFDRVFTTTGFRFAVIFAGLLVIAFAMAGAGAWYITKSTAENELHERIALEMDALQDELLQDGEADATSTIVARAHNPGALEYRLLDRNGELLIGDLQVNHSTPGWHILDLPIAGAHEEHRDFVVLTATTPSGGLLSIGENLANAERVRDAVLEALVWIGLAATALVLGAGALAVRGTLRRVDALSETLEKAGAGDLQARALVRTHGDDIDRIGSGVNDMLARVNLLVADVKRVSTNIAHDLRTPLAHVRQRLDTASTRTDMAAAQADVRIAAEQVEDVLRIFDAMLRLSEIEAGTAKARFGKVDLSDLVERVTDAYRLDIEAAGHVLEVSADNGATTQGDAALISQALANLLENALRHAGHGATLRVRLRNTDGALSLEVEDSGIGIPADQRERVLMPFERLDSSRTLPGAGLGLSIVNAIVRLHGATLSLEDAKPGLRAAIVWS